MVVVEAVSGARPVRGQEGPAFTDLPLVRHHLEAVHPPDLLRARLPDLRRVRLPDLRRARVPSQLRVRLPGQLRVQVPDQPPGDPARDVPRLRGRDVHPMVDRVGRRTRGLRVTGHPWPAGQVTGQGTIRRVIIRRDTARQVGARPIILLPTSARRPIDGAATTMLRPGDGTTRRL